MHVRRPGGDEADAPVTAILGDVEHRSFSRGTQLVLARVHLRQALAGIARHHHPAPRILGKAARRMRLTFADADQ